MENGPEKKVKFLAVFDSFYPGEIAFVKSLLNSEGIYYYIDNENAALIANANPRMTVMVPEDQSSTAIELLKDVR